MVSASNAKWKLLLASGPVDGVATTTPFDREGAGHVTIVVFAGAPVGGPFRALKVQQSGGIDRHGRLVSPADVPSCVVSASTRRGATASRARARRAVASRRRKPRPARRSSRAWARRSRGCPSGRRGS